MSARMTEAAGTVQEAAGTFFEIDHLKAAISALVDSGFEDEQIGILAGEHSVERALSDYYARPSDPDQSEDSPSVAFVTKNHEDDTFHGLAGGLFFCGATTMAGAIVASAAALGGAVLAGLGGVAAVGVVGAAAGMAIHKPASDRLKEQLDEGHFLLFVRARTAERANLAVAILEEHGAHEPAVYCVDGKGEGSQT